ncbi:hypothetical protein JQ99_004970 [Salmonella enterica subsp. enterica]|nr:hypothetical protein [Salmonella enterica subsp. enterica]EEJ6528870.1 hypothetical protein [Salmonella enterica]
MAITSAFLADDVGSIPADHSSFLYHIPCVAPLVTRRRWPIVTGQISGRKKPPKGRGGQ